MVLPHHQRSVPTLTIGTLFSLTALSTIPYEAQARSTPYFTTDRMTQPAIDQTTNPIPLLSIAQTTIISGSSTSEIFASEMLDAHNRYRSEVNVPPLVWSDTLAENAQNWADHLAAIGGQTLQHSEGSGEGENLWLGTSEYFSYTDMVDGWGEEKQYFVAGTFPDVSSTGQWYDVGHYTQIVWRDTKEVGCAIAIAGGNDILVCRYHPQGNYLGEPVF